MFWDARICKDIFRVLFQAFIFYWRLFIFKFLDRRLKYAYYSNIYIILYVDAHHVPHSYSNYNHI